MKKKVHFLNLEQVEKLVSIPNTQKINGLRDRAILETLFSTGLRIAELVSLDQEQMVIKPTTKDLEISIIGKGGHVRTVFFSERAIYWIKEYLDTRKDNNKALFISYQGRKIHLKD